MAAHRRKIGAGIEWLEIWREKNRLPEALREVHSSLDPGGAPPAMAVTMTAELSDIFSTKREGVLFVLESIRSGFPEAQIYVLSLSGEFASIADAQSRPLEFAASNWIASAQWIAREFRNCWLIDVGLAGYVNQARSGCPTSTISTAMAPL